MRGALQRSLLEPEEEMNLNPIHDPMPHLYIIVLEVTQVSDDSDPDEKRGRSKQNAAEIVICDILRNEKTDMSDIFYSPQLINLTLS